GRAIAERLTHAIDNRARTARMGERAAKSVSHLAWEPVVEALAGKVRQTKRRSPRSAVASDSEKRRDAESFAVTVLDMQPIDPPVGGGRLRLLGLYHALGGNLPTTYVGTYDWPGEKHRRHRLSETLEEIDLPLTDAHFAAAAEWSRRAGDR